MTHATSAFLIPIDDPELVRRRKTTLISVNSIRSTSNNMGEAKRRRAEIEQLKRNDPSSGFTVLNSSFRDQKQEYQKRIPELEAEIATTKHASRRKAA
jgi:hypothetical protein